MAKLDAKGMITGTAGPVYYRSFNGKTFVQTKPGKGVVKQGAGTKNQASDFGRASSLSKAIRASLFPILQHHADPAFYRRFTAAVNAVTQTGNPNPKGSRHLIDGDLSLLEDIDCNTASPFGSYCLLDLAVSLNGNRQLEIAVPAFNALEQIAQPDDATNAELAFLVTTINPETNTTTHAELFKQDFALKNELIQAQQFSTTALPASQLIVVSAAVFYYRNNNLAGLVQLNGKGFHPCGVVTVLK